jgi:hypothetical protein
MRLGNSIPQLFSAIAGIILINSFHPPCSAQAISKNVFIVESQLKASQLTANGVKNFNLTGESNQLLGDWEQPRTVLALTVVGTTCGSNNPLPDIELVAYDKDTEQIVGSLLQFHNPMRIYHDPSQIIFHAFATGAEGVTSADLGSLVTLNYEPCATATHPGRASSIEIKPLGSVRPTGAASYPGPIQADEAFIQITSDAPTTPEIILPVSGIASAPNSAPQLNIAPSPLAFGSVLVGTNKTLTITLRNNGGTACTVTSIARNGSSAFAYSPVGPLNINPGAAVTVTVTFTPWAAGADSAVLQVNSNDFTKPIQYINLTGSGATTTPCSIRVTPTTLNFGNVQIGTNSVQTFNLINSGGETCTVDRINLLTTSDGFAYTPTNTPISVPPAGTSVVTVVYTPLTNNSATGIIQINTGNDDVNRLLQVNLTATGTTPECQLGIGTSSLAFGSVIVGTNRQLSVGITNNSLTACTINSASITGGAGYTIVGGPVTPITVLPGTVTSLTVDFAPTNAASSTASLAINYASPTQTKTIALSGAGVAVAPNCTLIVGSDSFDPGPILNFGDVSVGGTNMLKVQISNESLTNCTVQSLVLTGSADFHLVAPTTPIVVPGAGMMEVALRYTPGAAGTDVGSLQIFKDAENPEDFVFEIGLTGVGVRPGLVVDTNTVDFGAVPVGTATTLNVWLANTNTVPCTISSMSVTGSKDFTIDPIVPKSQFILGPNTMLAVPVIYDPSVTGTGTATLVINSNDPNSPAQVPLRGVGLQSKLVVSPTSLVFGTLTLGATNTITLTLSNTGNTNCVVTGLSVIGNGSYKISGAATPISIAPGANVEVDVNYTPVSSDTILILDGSLKTKGNSFILGAP